MKRVLLLAALTAISVIFLTQISSAVPLSKKVLKELRDSGELQAHTDFMNYARSKGVDQPEPKSKALLKSAANPAVNYKALVILIDFPNKSYTSGYVAATTSDFHDLLFSEGIIPKGSMREFYLENSYGSFYLEGDVYGWYHAANNYSYYTNNCDGSDGLGSYPNNAQKLVEEAINAADADIDFSQYDSDGDGYVDGLFIVHAGTGYEESGNHCEIHSHKWSISPSLHDGVYVRSYSMEPEESAINGDMIPIGVFCHEFGHQLGLPDLYDTDYSSEGIGDWGLMSGGSYNGNSASPSQMCIWCKKELGWVNPVTVTSNTTDVEIPAIEYNPVGYRLWTNGTVGNQYFLVENRQRMGFDTYLPGHGVLIWHIDESQGGNTNDWHPLVFLEQADGKYDLQYNNNQGDGGDAYPGGGYTPSFTDKTDPNSKDYFLNPTQVAVWDVTQSDSLMYADMDVVWSRPYLRLTSYNFSDVAGGNGNGVLEAGETIDLTFTIANDWKDASSAEATLTIDDGILTINDDYASLGTISSGGSASNNADPMQFTIPSDYTSRIDSFFVTVTSDGGQFSYALPIEQNVGAPQILLVDDDNNDLLQTYYTNVFYKKRIPSETYTKYVSGSPDVSDLSPYDVVVWYTGDYRSSPLNSTDITTMENYLDAGGNLFLTGQGIAAQLSTFDTNFLNNYLKADYLTTAKVPLLIPDAGGQVLPAADTVVILSSGGANNQDDPDHLTPINGGVGELHYYTSESNKGAVSYAGSYKTMFMGFGFEGIGSQPDRFEPPGDFMVKVLNFFGLSAATGYPEISSLQTAGDQNHVVDQTPEISWTYYDEGGAPQQLFQIQVGTDADWSGAEMWDYQGSGSATSVEYAGAPLIDGLTYFFRARVNNGTQWSTWVTGQFRMNSVPAAPTNLAPDNLAGQASSTPTLSFDNAIDGEGDNCTYHVQVYADSFMTTLVTEASGIAEGSTSSSWVVDVALSDEQAYFWRVQGNDGFEDGEWSPLASFGINSSNSLPVAFDLIDPPDDFLLLDPQPSFSWHSSSDPDLYDYVTYRFEYATQSDFSGATVINDLSDTTFAAIDSLSFGQTYYWRVAAYDAFGGETYSTSTHTIIGWVFGDANGDGSANVGDAVFIINFVFNGGAAPDPFATGDVNGDCSVNVGDAVYLINFVFKAGPDPLMGCAK